MNLLKNQWFLIGAGLCGILILVVLFLVLPNGEVTQPIAFNHKKHRDNNVPCIVCHRFYKEEKRAGIPPVNVCITCHEDVIYPTPEKIKIQNYFSQHKAIPWQQVYKVPGHVFFSHRLHVNRGNLACKSCHGEVGQLEQPVIKQLIPLKMKYCIDCHKTVETIDNPYECIRCHR